MGEGGCATIVFTIDCYYGIISEKMDTLKQCGSGVQGYRGGPGIIVQWRLECYSLQYYIEGRKTSGYVIYFLLNASVST